MYKKHYYRQTGLDAIVSASSENNMTSCVHQLAHDKDLAHIIHVVLISRVGQKGQSELWWNGTLSSVTCV